MHVNQCIATPSRYCTYNNIPLLEGQSLLQKMNDILSVDLSDVSFLLFETVMTLNIEIRAIDVLFLLWDSNDVKYSEDNDVFYFYCLKQL